MAIDIGEVIERLLGVTEFTIEPLPGGITNANYRVEFGDEQVVLRVPGKDTELLGIDRSSEVIANRLAAAIGIAPEILAVDDETRCVVTRFIHARQVPMDELATEPTLGDAISRLREVHAAGSIPKTFDHFAVIRYYHELASARGVAEPFDFASASAVLDEIEELRPFRPSVLGHNDLLNANFLHDGSIRILDWEYAGMGDPFFDLANFSVNNEIGRECDEAILRHYFGRVDESLLTNLALMKLVAELREAMWGVVQVAISDLDVDFVSYASDRALLFEALLDSVDVKEVARSILG